MGTPSDENENNSCKLKLGTSPRRRSSNSSIPVSNVNNLDFIKQKLSNKSSNTFAKQERDIFLRNSLRSSGQVTKVKQTDSPISPSYQRRWNNNKSTPKSDKDCSNLDSSTCSKNLNRYPNSANPSNERNSKPLGAVASLGLANVERKKSIEYSPYRNKYLAKKESTYSPKKKPSVTVENLNKDKNKIPADPKYKCSDTSIAFIDLKCCKRIPTPPEVNEKNKIEYHSFDNIDDAASEKSTFSSTTLDSGISSHGQLNSLPMESNNFQQNYIVESNKSDKNLSPEYREESGSRKESLKNDFVDEKYIIEDISMEIANLQQDLLAEVEKISKIEPQKQESSEYEDDKVSLIDKEDTVISPDIKDREETSCNSKSRMKRVSTYVQIFSKGSQNKNKNVKKSLSLGKEFEDEQKSQKLEQEKDKSVFKSVFSKHRNLFEKKSESKQDKSSKKCSIPSVHSAKDSKHSPSKFGFYSSKNQKNKDCVQVLKYQRNDHKPSELGIPPDSGFFETTSTYNQEEKNRQSNPVSNIPKQFSTETHSLRNSPLQHRSSNAGVKSYSSLSNATWQEDSPVKECKISDNLLLEITDVLDQKRDSSYLDTSTDSPEDEIIHSFIHNMEINGKTNLDTSTQEEPVDSTSLNASTSYSKDEQNEEILNVNEIKKAFDKAQSPDKENNVRRESDTGLETVKKGNINALISKFESNG